MRIRRFAAAISIAALAVSSLACEPGTARGLLISGPTTGARVRLINALSGTSSLDLVVDGQVSASGIGFGAASQYVSITLASHRLQARSSTTGTTLVDLTRDLSTQGAFTMIPAAGLSQFGALFLTDDPTPVPGQVRVRAVNVAAGPSPFTLYLTGASGEITSSTPTVPTMLFGTASDYLQIAPGTYRVRIARAGTVTDIVDLGTLTASAGTVRTLLITDSPSGGLPTTLSVITDG